MTNQMGIGISEIKMRICQELCNYVQGSVELELLVGLSKFLGHRFDIASKPKIKASEIAN